MITAILAGLAAVATSVAAWTATVLQAVNSIPWRRIFMWALLGVFILYFSQVMFGCFRVAWACVTTVFDSPSSAINPSQLANSVVDFSLFWLNMQELIPPFFRWLMWWTGIDWMFWLFFQFLHFWFVGYLLEAYGRPIGVLMHRALQSL